MKCTQSKNLQMCLRVACRAAADMRDARVEEHRPASMQQTCAGNTHTHTHTHTHTGAQVVGIQGPLPPTYQITHKRERERAAQALLLCALFFPQEKIPPQHQSPRRGLSR